jgi:hypothetical protein
MAFAHRESRLACRVPSSLTLFGPTKPTPIAAPAGLAAGGRCAVMMREGDIIDPLHAEIRCAYGIEAALTGISRSPCEQTIGDRLTLHLDHIDRLVAIKRSLLNLFEEQGKLAPAAPGQRE